MKRLLTTLFTVMLLAAGQAQTWNVGATYSDNVIATLSNGSLTITTTGTGNMKNWETGGSETNPPIWYGNTDIKSVIIGDGVKNIGNFAFSTCTNLTSVTIGKDVTHIGDLAFVVCETLPSIIIPKGVTSIGDDAFFRCSGLTLISFEGDMPTFGFNIFGGFYTHEITLYYPYGAANWESYAAPDNVTAKAAWDVGATPATVFATLTNDTLGFTGKGAMKNWDFTNQAPWYSLGSSAIKNVIIDDGVTHIGNYAFNRCYSLTSASIGKGVTSIGDAAFLYCEGLTSITIPDSVTNIGIDAFYSCSGLTSITIPNSVTSIGNEAFAHCSNLTSITIPDKITSIGASMFNRCSSLTSITIPSGVTTIGHYAFAGCSGLTSITIPAKVTYIGQQTFASCSNLAEITFEGNMPTFGTDVFKGIPELALYYPCENKSWKDYADMAPDNVTVASNAFTVSFNNENDFTNIIVCSGKGNPVAKPSAPSKAGYTFDGWYEDYLFSRKYDFSTPITGNLMLYAKWTQVGAIDTVGWLLDSIAELNDNIAELGDNIIELNDSIAKLNGNIAELNDNIAKQSDTITLRDKTITKLKLDTTELNITITHLIADTIRLYELLTLCQESNNGELLDIITKLQNDTIRLNDEIALLITDTVRLYELLILCQESSNQELLDIIAQLQNDTIRLNNEIASLITDTLRLYNKVLNLQDSLALCEATSSGDCSPLLIIIDALKADTVRLSNENTILTTANNQLKTDTAALNAEITRLNAEIARLNELLANCDDSINNGEDLQHLRDSIDWLNLLLAECGQPNIALKPVSDLEINIYPNPVVSQLHIEILNNFSDYSSIVELYDMTGKRIYLGHLPSSTTQFTIDMTAFRKGHYILRIGNRMAKIIKK